MKNHGIYLIRIALILLLLGMFFGHLASESYRITEPKSGVMGFLSLRPLHVSSVYLSIITAGLGFLTLIIAKRKTTLFGTLLQYLHFSLWLIALLNKPFAEGIAIKVFTFAPPPD